MGARLQLSMLMTLVLALITACTRISGLVPAPAPLPAFGTLRAGAAKVDLTPVPGFPMGGHGIGGTVARGYWTRLWARAIYLEDAAGQSLALVSCDLWSMPAGLGDRVAEIVRASQPHVGREQIILAATHTHQSPGNYASARLYNDFAQRWGGFDRRLFEFLAHRIARAILEAIATRQEATVHWLQTKVPGLARNRSVEAFVLNPESRDILRDNADLPGDSAAYHAIDPWMTLLRVNSVRQPSATIALAAFVAVHPTSMSPATEVYNSDLFGVASTLAEHDLRTDPDATAPIVALFNGAQGDISPAWKWQDRRDTLRLGRLLADKMMQPGLPFEPLQIDLAHRFRIAPLAASCYMEKANTGQEEEIQRCTAAEPLPGVAMLGGAEDGRTVLYELGWQEGVKSKGQFQPNQGVKQPALDPTFLSIRLPVSITRLAVSSASVPTVIPLGVYRLGPRIVIAALPGEFTMVMGQRIATAIQDAVTPRPDRVLLIGLANEYVSYFTTPQEYEAQHYEGASTLYGPHAGPLVQHDLHDLATSSPTLPRPHRFSYRPGRSERFGLHRIGAPRYAPDGGLATIALDLDTGLPLRDLPRFCWSDKLPVMPASYSHAMQVTLTPQVAIDSLQFTDTWVPFSINGVAETDAGLDFVTVVINATDTRSNWCAIWMPPPEVDKTLTFRFRVHTLHHDQTVYSKRFQLRAPLHH